MYPLTTLSVLNHDRGFCSRGRRPAPPIRTIEEGVHFIEILLRKKMFCCHDIVDINDTFKTIDKLEKKVERISARNSHYLLEQIIKKVEAVFRDSTKSPESLISLYYLQQFTGSKFPIGKYFNLRSKEFDKSAAQTLKLAVTLPYCISEEQFNRDTLSLIGENPHEKASVFLDRKRRTLRNHQTLIETIAIKQRQLSDQRETNPQKYPIFLDVLLENGFVHLYDHLLEMQELSLFHDRASKIESMSFSKISYITLETREAIIKTVVDAIPSDRNNVLFLIGGTGSGKSTTLCYLRGDRMKLKDNHYESENDAGLIGHRIASSCTFLPTIEIVNDLVLVDFPGFDDTNGPLISLGLEFALKALINKYSPKILVLESITNDEGKYQAAAQLATRLDRLLENKNQCVLGLTKYSKDFDYMEFKTIEKKQAEELREDAEVKKEAKLATIESLRRLGDPALTLQIEKLEQELADILQHLTHETQQSLPDTDEKNLRRSNLILKEQELLRQTGLGTILKFDDLSDVRQRTTCLQSLTDNQNANQVKSLQRLDPNNRKLLEQIFESNLLTEIESHEEYYSGITDIKEFEAKVLESSVTQTILSESNPEIGCLLHLPEMDPTIVREFDKKIVSGCFKKVIGIVVKVFDVVFLENIIQDLDGTASRLRVAGFKAKLESLRKYVIDLLGHPSQTETEINESWVRIKQAYAEDKGVIDRNAGLPVWAKVLLCLPAAIPYGIFLLVDRKRRTEMIRNLSDATIDQYSQGLDELTSVLVRLKEIEHTITKQEEIEKAFANRPISVANVAMLQETILAKINQVRNIYGAADWDARVAFLKNRFSFPTCTSPHCPYLIACELLDQSIWIMRFPTILSQLPNVSFSEQAAATKAFLLETNTETVFLRRGNHALTSIRIMKEFFEKALDCKAPKTVDIDQITISIRLFLELTGKLCHEFLLPQAQRMMVNIPNFNFYSVSTPTDQKLLLNKSESDFFNDALQVMINVWKILQSDDLLSSNSLVSQQIDEKWRSSEMDRIALEVLSCFIPELKMDIDWKKTNADELNHMNMQNPLHRTLIAAVVLEHGKEAPLGKK